MGFYSQVIFPHLSDLLLNRPFIAQYRRNLLATAHGEVLEIGFGTGLNLPYYPACVRKITTVDPNVGMHRLAQQRIRRSKIEVDHRVLSGERLPFEGGTFDCAISTFTLCSIGDVSQALSEVPSFRYPDPSATWSYSPCGRLPVPAPNANSRRSR